MYFNFLKHAGWVNIVAINSVEITFPLLDHLISELETKFNEDSS